MIGARVSDCIEEASTAMDMPPALLMQTLGVGAEVKIRTPRFVIEIGGVRWPGYMSFAAIAELYFRAWAAIRTIDEKHGL